MMLFKLKHFIAATVLFFSGLANAGLILVEQYDDFWSQDVNSLINYANNNTASASGYFEYIDFTDDPSGFAGLIPGSNPWPSAAAVGATGTSNPLNDTFFAKITGDFNVLAFDNYFFRTFNDDGVFLYVDGQLILSDSRLHGEEQFIVSKELAAGLHSFELYFFENGGEASLEFSVADSSQNFVHFNAPNSPLAIVDVPAPATLSIFTLGLVCLVSRKKSKQ